MINHTQIRAYTNSSSYSKGKDLYKGDKVLEFTIDESDDELDTIDAVVKGSERNLYQVSIHYDKEEDWLEDAFCECPAFAGDIGICEHCAAVLFEYVDYLSRQKAIDMYARKREESLEKLQGMKGINSLIQKNQKVVHPKTTPAFKNLLTKRRVKRGLPVFQAETYGKVKLEPCLYGDSRGEFFLEFKIGITRMYVLQDIDSFMRNLENQAEWEYGAKLKLVHAPEMFDEESRKLIQFMKKWMIQYRWQNSSYYDSYYSTAMRQMLLSCMDMELFLDAVGDREISGTIEGQAETVWKMTTEPLPRRMKITGSEAGATLETNSLFGIKAVFNYVYFVHGSIYKVSRTELEPIGDFLSMMAHIPERKVFIQKEDLPVFCQDLLPELEKHFVCTKEQFEEEDYKPVPVTFELYLDAPQNDMITCKPIAVYGDKKYDVYGKTTEEGQRDLVREAEIGKLVSSYCNAYDDVDRMMVAARDAEVQVDLLVNGVPKFQQVGEVYISDALKKMKVTRVPKLSVGVSLSGDLLELTITAGDMPRDQLLEILSKYDRKKKFYRLKNGDFVNMDGEDLQVLLELKEELNLTEAQLRHEMVALPKYRALYLDEELGEQKNLKASRNMGFKNLVRNMKSVEDCDVPIPDHLSGILREYQTYGFQWMKILKHNGFCGILADDMGLGKTLQVIAFLASELAEAGEDGSWLADSADRKNRVLRKNGENKRTLIVSPASLVFNWNSEFQRFAPDLAVTMVVGSAEERRSRIQSAGEREILLTSYDLLKRDVEWYEEMTFFCQVVDEAQYIKNHNTQAARAVKSVRAGFKLALTGTPVENRLSELWSIFDYLMPGFLYSYQKFKEELEQPIVQRQEEAARIRLQKMIRPFVLRRLKRDVLKELPDKIEKCVYAGLAGEQQKLYDAHVKRMKLMLEKQSDEEFRTSKIQILSELTKLRQICCHPALLFDGYEAGSVKLDLCLDLIENAIGSGHKILLFSQFTSMLEKLQEQLHGKGIPFYALTGAVSKEKRARMVEQFNQDDTPVFCISLKAGGTGLNLTAADIVIHYDPWWNLAVQNQATDRAHRIGQTSVVTVYKLIVKDTIEENIMKLQEKKRELADRILSGDGMGSGSFSREELLELL